MKKHSALFSTPGVFPTRGLGAYKSGAVGWLALVLAVAAPRVEAEEPAILRLRVDVDAVSPGLDYGIDAKLTAKSWAASPQSAELMARFFRERDFGLLRVPVYPVRRADDPIYDHVIALMRLAKAENPNVIFFLSVANGDGDKNNWLHGKEKFPPHLRTGPATSIYQLDLAAYAKLLDAMLVRFREAGVPVQWLGPFNEDHASAKNVVQIWRDLKEADGLTRVGVETWALGSGIQQAGKLAPHCDIVGSHFYDDQEGPEIIPRSAWTSSWARFVAEAKKPVWFTEATDYKVFEDDSIDALLGGAERLFAAINGGVRGVVFYQPAPRLVSFANVPTAKKWPAFHAMIRTTRADGFDRLSVQHDGGEDLHVIVTRSKDRRVQHLHFLNLSAETLHLAPPEAPVHTRRTAQLWDAARNGEPFTSVTGEDLQLPPRSYLHLTLQFP